MDKIHEIILPLKVIVGPHAIYRVRDIVEEITRGISTRVGIVTGATTYNRGGKIVENELINEHDVYLWKVEDSHISTADEIANNAREKKIGLVIGIGGGKSIDIAKYVAFKNDIKVISVPLAPSHDGIASPFASLKGVEKPYSVYTRTPYAIVADTKIIANAPRRLILSGIGDLLGKLVSVKDWELSHRLKGEYYGEYAAQLALMSAKHVIKYHEIIAKGTEEGIRILVEALISSGVAMCIAGSSRPASGSEHLFSHALDIVSPGKALHGEQVALGTIMMLYIYGDPRWKLVRRIAKKIGLPTSAYELNIEPDKIIEALTMAHKIRPERYTILGENGLTRDAAYAVARETGVI
ncbi:MAG: NAD(P)-dependent glycerol-1-phosphate dehydrogenase [Desulfurococcaceae archaeon]